MRALASGVLLACLLSSARPVAAAPPYETRDADPASALELDAYLGLLRWYRVASDDTFLTPNLWLDFGLGLGLELVAELSFDPDATEMRDFAAGAKWSLGLGEQLSLGLLVLAHLPTSGDDDLATEGAVVATIGNWPWRGHVNAGVIRDGDSAWRVSGVIERKLGPLELGAEVYAREVGEGEDVRAGIGAVIPVGGIDVRASGHVGLTDEAPELALAFWLSRRFVF